MKNQNKKIKPSLTEIKNFWDGPRVGFNKDLYKSYIERKKSWKTKMN